MFIDLNDLEGFAQKLCFLTCRRSESVLEVKLHPEATLVFKNLEDEGYNAFGFETSPWHTHDKLYCVSRGYRYEYSPSEVISGYKSGELVIFVEHLNGQLNDMWIDRADAADENQASSTNEKVTVLQYNSS